MADTTPGAILASLRLTQAMTLARSGKWREAEASLVDAGQTPTDPLQLHALAALVTAQGNYLRALKLWETLRKQDPGHAEAKRMIEAIELWLSRPSWARYFPIIIGGVLVAVIALFLWFALSSGPSPSRTVSPPSGISASPATDNASPVSPTPAPGPAPVISFPQTKPAHKHSSH